MIDYNKLKEVISNLDDKVVLIAGHKNTDYDSMCSCLAISLYLNKIGKKAYVLFEEKDLNKLNWFKKLDYVINEYSSDEYNFILLDSNRKSRLGIFEEYFDKANIKINIDHHEDNKCESDYIFVDENISSTCEIIYNLVKDNLDKDIATLLYAGIASDTNSFYKRVTPCTMMCASKLLEYDIDNSYIIKNVCKSMTLEESKILRDMLNNINYDGFYYIIMDRNNELYKDIDYSIIFKKCASIIYEITDINVLGLFLKELDGSISGLFRSNCDINVDKLATTLGGGGHKKASGFENNMNIDEILEITKKYIRV